MASRTQFVANSAIRDCIACIGPEVMDDIRSMVASIAYILSVCVLSMSLLWNSTRKITFCRIPKKDIVSIAPPSADLHSWFGRCERVFGQTTSNLKKMNLFSV